MSKNCCPDADWLRELETAELNELSLQIKAFARASSGQQGAVIGDVGDNLHPVAIEKLLRRKGDPRLRRSNPGKRSCTQ